MLVMPIFQLVSSHLISSQDNTRSTRWRSLYGLFMSSSKSFRTLNVQIIITIIIMTIMITMIIIIMMVVFVYER